MQISAVKAGRVAALVDGENVSHDHARIVAEHAGTLGKVVVRRVYGDVGRLPGWDATLGFRLIHSGTGKNATDLLLTVDAMDLALSGFADIFVLVSSDSDFTHLATRLREKGFGVIGMGPTGTVALRRACSDFVVLPSPKENDRAALAGVEAQVAALVTEAGGTLPIASLSSAMWTRHGIRISTTPEKKWHSWLSARADLFNCDPRGPAAMVRLRA